MKLDKFWMVLGSGTPTYRHSSAMVAKAEAERLARINPGQSFTVLESLATVCKTDITWQPHGTDDTPTAIPF